MMVMMMTMMMLLLLLLMKAVLEARGVLLPIGFMTMVLDATT